jgi:FHS family L-fucose permease-like MFS transporter
VFAHRSFVWAIVAQFFYVGAQIGVWSYFIDFTKELTPLTPEKTAAFYLSASLLSFMVGRFIGTYLMKYIAPRRLLALYALINIGLVGVALVTSGMTAVVALGATSFFMSIMFPTIYALGLEHLGDQAEMGSSLIIMTIISGAIIPPMMGYLSDVQSVQWAYAVPLVCYFMVWLSTRLGGLEQGGRQPLEQPA